MRGSDLPQPSLAGLDGTEMEEQGHPTPAVPCGLAELRDLGHVVDEEARGEDGPGDTLERAVDAGEGHRQPIALDRVRVALLVEVRAPDLEDRVGFAGGERTGGVDRMDEGGPQTAVRHQDSGCLAHGAVEVVEVLGRHEGRHEVEACIGKWEMGGVDDAVIPLGIGLARRRYERR